MRNRLEEVEDVVRAAAGRTVGGELAFTFPEVLRVIQLCTANEISVLGVEVFEVRSSGYFTTNLSTYDQRMESNHEWEHDWEKFVGMNNTLAEAFVKANASGDDHIYVLTTASSREFREAKGIE